MSSIKITTIFGYEECIRAGSLPTKPALEQYFEMRKRLQKMRADVKYIGRMIEGDVTYDDVYTLTAVGKVVSTGEPLFDEGKTDEVIRYLEPVREAIDKTLAKIDNRDRIRALKQVTEEGGATPGEAENARRALQRLEARNGR